MRENMGLYRGKRKDNGKFVEGFYIFDGFDHYIVKFYTDENAEGTLYPVQEAFEVIPETVGMCSGVPDKHGNLIYEDDFVRIDDDVKETFKRVEDGPVRFSRGGFFVNNYGDILSSFDVIADFRGVLRGEVIGNIHDNQELLEVK